MKLHNIIEAVNRRDFLKQAGTVAMSASPIGKFLLSSGVAPKVVEALVSGQQSTIPFMISIGDHYGRDSIPDLSEQFDKISGAYKIAKGISKSTIMIGTDESSYFSGDIDLKHFVKILKAAQNKDDGTVNLYGLDWTAFDEGDSIGLEPLDSDSGLDYTNMIRIYRNGQPHSPPGYDTIVNNNPIKTWWDRGGKFGEEIIDAKAKAVVDQLDLDCNERNIIDREWVDDENNDEEYNDEEYNDEEYDEEHYRPEWHGGMHQWIENKLKIKNIKLHSIVEQAIGDTYKDRSTGNTYRLIIIVGNELTFIDEFYKQKYIRQKDAVQNNINKGEWLLMKDA